MCVVDMGMKGREREDVNVNVKQRRIKDLQHT